MDEQAQLETDDSNGSHSTENEELNSCGSDNNDDSDFVVEKFNFLKSKVTSDKEDEEEDEDSMTSDPQQVIDTSLKETTNLPKEKSRIGSVRCSAIGCDHTKNGNLCVFIPFPKDDELKQRWVLAMQRCYVDIFGKLHRNRLWEPKLQHRLCSCHFPQPTDSTEKPQDFADLIPDTFDFSEDASGKRKSRSKFRLKLNNAVISRSEIDNSLSVVELNDEETTEEYITGSTLKSASVCSALGCEHSKEELNCTLLKFPTDLEWRKRWVIAMERCYVSDSGVPDRGRPWEPNYHHKLCTCHFSFPIEIRKRDPELRHIIPDLFNIPDENKEVCDNRWAKCRLRITGVEEFEFSQKYLEHYEDKNKKEKEKRAEKDKIPTTFNQIISNTTEKCEKDQVTKVPVDKNLNVCSALTCTHKIYDKTCSFVSFPKDPIWRERWVIALQRCHVSREGIPDPDRLWEPTEQHKMCSCHFSVGINTRTRKRGYNHIIPDLVSFPDEEELGQEVEVWMKHRLKVTDQHRIKLLLTPDEVLNTTVEDTPVTEKAAASAQDSFVTEVVPTETEDSISDANDSNHLYGLLTKQKLDQVTLLPYQDPVFGNMKASHGSLKLPLFIKYHSNGKEMSIEADCREKQFHSHCAAVGCLHRVSQKICSFLSFPKDYEWRQKWAFALRRCYVDENGKPDLQRLWEPRDHHRLCTCHFSFPINAKTRKTGYNHVLPDVLSFPDDNNKKNSSSLKENSEASNRHSATNKVAIKIEPVCEMENSFSLNNTSGIQQYYDDMHAESESMIQEEEWLAKNSIPEEVEEEEAAGDDTRGMQRDDFGHTVCSAPGCSHRRGENYCSFVSFPKYPELREKWVASIQRYEVDTNGEKKLWEPGENHKLCVCHFSKPINVRSRAPEVKLIVPDILDTSSFIAIPTSKKVPGNKRVCTLKRVDASLVTKEDVAGWLPHEMEMFLVKNKRRRDFKSRQQLLDHVWSFVLHKRNKSTQTADQTEQSPASKRQKISDSSSSPWQAASATGQNNSGSLWYNSGMSQGPTTGAHLMSSIMQKVITEFHQNTPQQQGSNGQEADVKPSSQTVPLPVGFIDMSAPDSFHVNDDTKLENHASKDTGVSSDALKNLLRSSKNGSSPSGSSETLVNIRPGNKRKQATTEANSSLLKSVLTVQRDHKGASGDHASSPQSQASQKLAFQSERFGDSEEEQLDETEMEWSHRESLNELKAEFEQLKHGKSVNHRTVRDSDEQDNSSDNGRNSNDSDSSHRRRWKNSPKSRDERNSKILDEPDLSSVVIQKVKTYVCEFCDMEFKKKALLFSHKTKWHSEQNVREEWIRLEEVELGESSSQNAGDEGDLLMCRECGDEYDTNEELEQHMKTHSDL